MATFIDITRPIHSGMAIYPGNPAVTFKQVSEAVSTSSALTQITLGSHTGTHIDAPSHIISEGKGTGSYDLSVFVGDTDVIEIKKTPVITVDDLPSTSAPRVLIKTVNSGGDINEFNPDFVALDESAAKEFVKRGVKLVGINSPSIKKKGVHDRVHAILLEAGIVIVESLWLQNVEPGQYELICLPLAVDLDGAPVRAVLRK